MSKVLAIAAWSMMVILFLEGLRVLADKVLGRRFAEGEKEANRKWQAWLERKEEAERKNEPFDEPPQAGRSRDRQLLDG